MIGNRTIPEHLQDKVNAMPEYSYGVTRVRAILADGSRIEDVFVAWGREIVKVGASDEVSFDPAKIIRVERP